MPARPSLQILTTLRFFAAAEVVFFHATRSWNGWPVPDTFLKGLAAGGYAAVTFFFVLSGFILVYAHAGETLQPRTFWRRRFARLAPAYFLGLLIALPVALNTLQASLASDGSQAFGLLLVVVFLQAWWPSFATLWNGPAWSLSVECVFYALFPWLRGWLARPSLPVLAVVAYALILVTTLCRVDFLSQPLLEPGNVWLLRLEAYFPLLLVPQFLFGMVLARGWQRFGPAVSPQLHAAMMLAGAAAAVLIFGFSTVLPWWTRSEAVLALVFGLIIFGGAGADSILTLLTRPFMVLLGEASYSIYILHIPLLYWWWELRVYWMKVMPMPVAFALYGLVLVALSVLTFLRIETPLRRRLSGGGGVPRAAGA